MPVFASIDCFIHALDYKTWYNIAELPMVYSAGECQKKCQETPDCNFFTYHWHNRYCWTKTSTEGRYVKVNISISGPRECSVDAKGQLIRRSCHKGK